MVGVQQRTPRWPVPEISVFSLKSVGVAGLARRYRRSLHIQARAGGVYIIKADRYWGVVDSENILVCLTVYRKGAIEVVRRLAGNAAAEQVEVYPDGSYLFIRGKTLKIERRREHVETTYAGRRS